MFTSSPCVPPYFPAALEIRLGSRDWVLFDGNVGRDGPTFKNTLPCHSPAFSSSTVMTLGGHVLFRKSKKDGEGLSKYMGL